MPSFRHGLFMVPIFLGSAQASVTWMRLAEAEGLSGWRCQESFWRAHAGVIYGEGKAPINTYCHLPGRFSDFVLVAKTRLWQTEAGYTNSGIQYRSAFLDSAAFRMKGYQWDIGDGWDGSMFPEGHYPDGAATLRQSSACEKANRRNDWNQVVIIADGDSIFHELNGTRCLAYRAEIADGYIGLQLHTTKVVMRVEFKDLFIRPLHGSFSIPDSLSAILDSSYTPASQPGLAIHAGGPLRRGSARGYHRPGVRFDLVGRGLGSTFVPQFIFGNADKENQ